MTPIQLRVQCPGGAEFPVTERSLAMVAAAIVYLLLIIAWVMTPAPISTVLGAILILLILIEAWNVFRGWRAGEFKY